MNIVLSIILLFSSFLSGQIKSTDKFLQEVANVYVPSDGLPEGRYTTIIKDKNGNLLANSEMGEYILTNGEWGKIINKSKAASKNYTAVAYNGSNYVAKQNGLFVEKDEGMVEIFPKDEKYNWKLSNVTVLKVDKKNRFWFGADQGVGYLKNGEWKLYTGHEGLPFKYFTSIESSPNGDIWFGTKKGAIRTDGEKFYYRFSRRWLADDFINDILVEDDGTVWFATNKGISKITFLELSLEEKADLMTKQVEERHTRMGFIAQNALKTRYDADSFELDISDNDGLYTSWYGAAQAFRYAVTGSEEAKKLAKRSFDACKWLVDITHEKGFPARVIVPLDWRDPVNEQYDHDYNIRKQKEDPFWKDITPRFPKSKDGKYLWKCDTSSDELAGHYFFYAIYYDLVADTESEKKLVREVVGDITDHMIRHGFVLNDHDGKPTRWGNFSPEFFNSVWGWDQKGLNSMMMLSFLNIAHHVTGDIKYKDTAQKLMDEHQYHINAMLAKMYFPPEDVVPWDNNLSLMSFYGLLNYEDNPELFMMYRESLDNAWLHISKQKNSFWNVLYAAGAMKFNKLVDSGIYESGKYFPEAGSYAQHTAKEFYKSNYETEDIIETLQRLPLDLIGYEMDNRHRLDILFDQTPGQVVQEGWRPVNPIRTDNTFEVATDHKGKMGWHIDGKALPIDERAHVRLDRDGFAIYATEGSGYTESEGSIYLLPYYMARYHGIIK